MDWQTPNSNNPYNNNPYNNNSGGNPYSGRPLYPAPPSGDKLATAALVLGILAPLSSVTMTVYPPFIFGSIAILLALLSRGKAPRIPQRAKIGILCAFGGILLNLAIVSFCIYLFATNPAIREQVDLLFQQTYGMTMEEFYRSAQTGNPPYVLPEDPSAPADTDPEEDNAEQNDTTYVLPEENEIPDYPWLDL